MVLVKIVRLETDIFPRVATQQHWVGVTFFWDSDKIHGNCTATNLLMPQALGKWTLIEIKIRFLTMPAKHSSCQQWLLSKVAEDHHRKKFVNKGIELIGNPAPWVNISSLFTLQECFHSLFSNICPGVGGEEHGWKGSAGSLNPVPIDHNRGFKVPILLPWKDNHDTFNAAEEKLGEIENVLVTTIQKRY